MSFAIAAFSALLSLGAAGIHAWVVPEHLHEYWLFGAFFIVVAAGQAVWAGSVTRWPNRNIYLLGAMVSVLLIGLWAVSRTVGLPLGPEPWEPEPAAGLDVTCFVLEAGIIVLAAITIYRSRIARRKSDAVSRRTAAPLALQRTAQD
jgi:hypothetical protein